MNSNEFEDLLNQSSTSRPKKSKNQMPQGALKNREAGLWRLISDGLKSSERKIETTRLESWALPGVPDVLLCSEGGVFSFLELKVTKGRSNKLGLSAHQCAWLSRHSNGPCFIVIRDSSLDIRVFCGSDVVDLRMDGLAAVPPLATFEEPYDWKSFFRLTSPVQDDIGLISHNKGV